MADSDVLANVRGVIIKRDADPNGWCSLCGAPAARGVNIRLVAQTGGSVQAMPCPDVSKSTDRQGRVLDKTYFHYRFGACCIGRMVVSLEGPEED